MTMTVGNDEQQDHVADDDSSDKKDEGSKGDDDSNEVGGQQRRQGQQSGQLHWQGGWCATKRAIAMAARAMATRLIGEQRQQGQ
jgi:hypothetical protein